MNGHQPPDADMTVAAAAPGALSLRGSRLLRWCAAVAAGLLVLLLMGPRHEAGAAEIPGAITSITTTTTTVATGDIVDFACTWKVPDHSSPGDTFTLTLPPQLRWFSSTTFTLTDPSGAAVAIGHANPDGTVVFTLTDFVATHPVGVHGGCSFSTQYATQQAEAGPETLTFTVGGTAITVPVTDKGPVCTVNCPVSITDATKQMWWTSAAQNDLQSVIVLPATTAQSSSVTITDTPAAGLALDCSTLTPRVGKAVDGSFQVIEPGDEARYPATLTCTPTRATLSWTGLPAGEYPQLWVRARVTDGSLGSYTNSGLATVNAQQQPVGSQLVRSNAGGTGNGTTTPPAPTTTAPSTTAPSTTVPATTVPATTAPATTAPSTTAPSTTAPSTTAPATTTPAAPSTSPSPGSSSIEATQVTAPTTSAPHPAMPRAAIPSAVDAGYAGAERRGAPGYVAAGLVLLAAGVVGAVAWRRTHE